MKANKATKTLLCLAAAAVAAAQLLIPDPAAAAAALFRMNRKWVDADPYTSASSLPSKKGAATAYLGSTTPAQKVIIPAELIKNTTYVWDCRNPGTKCWAGYPTSILYYSYWNYRGFFYPNNPNAAIATTTVHGVTSTTRNGGNYADSRFGTVKITPGPNRFGGTMRYFYGPDYRSFNRITNVTPCCSTGTGRMYRTPSGGNVVTEYLQQKVGSTYPGWVGVRRHTYLTTGYGALASQKVRYFYTTAPWTTGALELYMPEGNYATRITLNGYDNRTNDGYYGKLSLVVPWLVHNYLVIPGEPITAPWHEANVNGNTLTFLGAPEPGGILLLGAGVLTLVGLIRLRRR